MSNIFLIGLLEFKDLDLLSHLLPHMNTYQICDAIVNWKNWLEAVSLITQTYPITEDNFKNMRSETLSLEVWPLITKQFGNEAFDFACHHRIYSYLVKEFSFEELYRNLPLDQHVNLFETIIRMGFDIKNNFKYSEEIKYVINLNLVLYGKKPKFTQFQITAYLPQDLNVSVIDYLATLPNLPFVSPLLLQKGKYILERYIHRAQ